MAVAYEADGDNQIFALSSMTISVVTTAADYLAVKTAMTDSTLSVSTVTHNADTVSFVNATESASPDIRIELWERVAPDLGTLDVVITYSGSAVAVGGAVGFTGVHQTTPSADFTAATGASGTNPSVTVPNVTADDYVLDCVQADNATTTLTVGANQTQLWNRDPFKPCAGSVQDGADGGAMTWTIGTGAWRMAGVRIVAAAAGAATWGPLMALKNNRLVAA